MPLLQFVKPYKSITKFNPIELPNLAVLTGKNGSGKTHLLRSILDGSSKVGDISPPDIKYFEPNSFFASEESKYSNKQIDQDRVQAWEIFNQDKRSTLKFRAEFTKNKNKLGADAKRFTDLADALDTPIWELTASEIGDAAAFQKLVSYKQDIKKLFDTPTQNKSIARSIFLTARKARRFLDELTEREFKDIYTPRILKDDFLPVQLGKIFLDYEYRKYVELVVKRAEANHYQEQPRFKDSEDFEKKYGPPPWKIIDAILGRFSALDFSINNPENLRFSNDSVTDFSIEITNGAGNALSFNDLSSGEKILFALVLSIYKASGDNYFPKLLLLDEIDASLHPSMIRNMLTVLTETFASQNQVNVILSTHSPSTVALCPADSIFVIEKGTPTTSITKQSPQHALSILTEGFISLDQGLTIADQMARKKVTIFTEGNNIDYLERAIVLMEPALLDKVEIIKTLRDRSGTQLDTLFEFFLRLDRKNHALFVFDCDHTRQLTENQTTHLFRFQRNPANKKFNHGIENAFSEKFILDEHFRTKLETRDNGTRITTAVPDKRQICNHILSTASREDFAYFQPLIDRLKVLTGES